MKMRWTKEAPPLKEKKVQPVPQEGIGELEPIFIWNLPEVCRRHIRENSDFLKILEVNVKIEEEKQKLLEKIGAAKLKDGISAGEDLPVLDRKSLQLKLDKAPRSLSRIIELLEEYRPELKGDLEKIQQTIGKDKKAIKELVKQVICAERVEVGDGVNADLAVEVLELAARPFFEAYSRTASSRLPDKEFFEGACPICGGEPYLSILRDEAGKKLLRCGLCDWEWRVPRIKCPFCGTEEQKKLQYLEIPGKEGKGWKIEVCLDCRRYLKSVDTREAGEIRFPRVLDLATLPYDILAENEGYRRRPIRLAKK